MKKGEKEEKRDAVGRMLLPYLRAANDGDGKSASDLEVVLGVLKSYGMDISVGLCDLDGEYESLSIDGWMFELGWDGN